MNTGHPDRAAIEAGQLAALRAMIGALVQRNQFYTRKWQGCGLSDTLTGLNDFFARAPFTLKQEIVDDQRAHPPYGTDLTYPLERYTRFNQTSGTTGVPIRWLDTPESWSWMVENWVRVLRAADVAPGARLFFAFSFGPFLGFWTAFEAGARLGCMCLPGGGMSSTARLRVMLDNGVSVLCCTPTYALRLGEVAAEEGIELRGVRTIIAAGEPGASIPGTRERIERMWPGARLHDHHGMTEVGPVTFECPERRGVLHVMENGYIPEVVTPATGAHVQPGETGELVLTNLGRVGSPLIRYRTGDIVKRAAEERCACGRYELALEGGILGRADDMVVIRGVNLHPGAFEEVIRRFDSVAEYRVENHADRALPELKVQLEPVAGCADPVALGSAVEAALRAAFNLRVPVSVVPPGALPRFELKAKRWVRVETGGTSG
ncbi:MAG TPA: AMP-binding protein [Armatimonadota bacterium]|nr:AMP-binding protein [Armatimonadota bacterium]